LALASAIAIRLARSASATCISFSEAGRLLADLLLPVELGDFDRLLLLGLPHPDFLELQRAGNLNEPIAFCLGDPNLPDFSCSATSPRACCNAVEAAFRPSASMYPDSSRMSVMLTLISTRPIFLSSGSTEC